MKRTFDAGDILFDLLEHLIGNAQGLDRVAENVALAHLPESIAVLSHK